MRIVVALGGNALLKRGEPMTAENQRANVRRAAAVLADLVRGGHTLVITHGNGPQVGLLALQAAASSETPFPLDVLDAESAGMIGYVLQQELGNAMKDKLFATLLTQVRVTSRSTIGMASSSSKVMVKGLRTMPSMTSSQSLASRRGTLRAMSMR